jgi:5'-nucleotidase
MESQSAADVPFVLLDLDDTLLDQKAALRSWARAYAAENGLAAHEADWLTATGVATPSWRGFAEKIYERYDHAKDVDRLVRALTEEYPRHFVLDSAVAEGLRSLRERGLRLGIVTNGATIMQTTKIDHVGLRAYVDAVCISEAAGVSKPDPRIFDSAVAGLGVGPGARGWMVGDNLVADIAGGQTYGLRTVWLALGRPLDLAGPRPDHVAGSIVDALKLIGENS